MFSTSSDELLVPGGVLFVSKGDALHCVVSPEPRERAEGIVKEGWLCRGTSVTRLFTQRHAGSATARGLLRNIFTCYR